MMPNPHITVIANAHREGLLAGPSLRSLDQATASAARAGLSVEVVCVLDRSDAPTRDVFADWAAKRSNVTLVQLDLGDLGLARNHGVSMACGKWVAFLDCDDLWSANWLTAAHAVAEADSRRAVWHPEVNLYFGARPHIFLHIDMDDPAFTYSILAQTNLWTALCFAERSLLTEVPYKQTDLDRQVGFEDWGWNIATMARGSLHKIVPGTTHAVRTKAVSLLSRTLASECLPPATDLFRDILAERERASIQVGQPHPGAVR